MCGYVCPGRGRIGLFDIIQRGPQIFPFVRQLWFHGFIMIPVKAAVRNKKRKGRRINA
jgi:hypothetical protein